MARRSGSVPNPDDFGPYFVDQADTYYQGPYRSTRVQAHQFVPLDPEVLEDDEVLGKQFRYWTIRGHIYVRWWKKGNVTKYGPCTLQDYRTFREYYSKGRYVRFLEQFGYTDGGGDKVDI